MDGTLELIKAAGKGDRSARDRILSENTGLIWSVVKKFLGRGYEADDLFQLGAIGLLKCIDKFDLDYGVKFSTYAVPMIMGEIKRFIRDDGMIKVSRSMKETAKKARFAQERLIGQSGVMPTVNELAKAVGVEPEELVMAMDSCREVDSLYRPCGGEDDGALLMDKLEVGSELNGLEDRIALKEIIGGLKPRERQVILLRYFRDKTQSETAKIVGVSQVQISRIEKKVLNMIRELLV